MISSHLEASGKQAPKSQLKRIFYHVGGGMMPGDHDYISLRREKNGELLLTVKGDCLNEKVTFAVTEEVFQHCDSLIRETELYKSKGHYQPEFQILDAPSLDFSVTYEDSKESFSASGDYPFAIGQGIRILAEYLYGLRGDRQAVGHLGRILDLRDETFMQTVWTNDYIEYTPDETGIEELYECLSEDEELEYEFHDWDAWRMKGSGFNCLVVCHRRESIMEVFLDKKTIGHTIRTDEDIAGQWPQTAQRPLLRTELEEIATDTLRLMQQEIKSRYPDEYRHPMTDLEQLNWELIDWELQWRKQHPEEEEEATEE